jgi:ribosome-binding factor A
MKRDRWSRRAHDRMRADPTSDDEIDPTTFFDNRSKKRTDVKTLRLCGEVAKAISMVFSGGCRDAVLQALGVCSVTPAPDASRLLVTVYSEDPGAILDPTVVIDHLQGARGLLTAEISAAIQRKRAPELIFRMAPREVEP